MVVAGFASLPACIHCQQQWGYDGWLSSRCLWSISGQSLVNTIECGQSTMLWHLLAVHHIPLITDGTLPSLGTLENTVPVDLTFGCGDGTSKAWVFHWADNLAGHKSVPITLIPLILIPLTSLLTSTTVKKISKLYPIQTKNMLVLLLTKHNTSQNHTHKHLHPY